jgi:DNA mismatch repair protein MutL
VIEGRQQPLGMGFSTNPIGPPNVPAVPETFAPAPSFDRIQQEIRPLGQLRSSYIVAADSSGVVLIDQHVAHERVLFEAYLRQKLAGAIEVQRLLAPIIVQLPPRQLAILDNIVPELARNGFEVEPFGPRTVAIKTSPAMLKPSEVETLLVELLDNLERETQAVDIAALHRKIAASVSCHAAIKINTPLDDTKMKWLVTELMKTDVPTVCPHGRPIILRYDLKEIEKGFKRA